MKYRRKQFFHAVQWDGNWATLEKFVGAIMGGEVQWGKEGFPNVVRQPDGNLMIHTNRGVMEVHAPTAGDETREAEGGDWLFWSSEDELLAVDRDVFETMFEPVPSETFMEEFKAQKMNFSDMDIEEAVYTAVGSASMCWAEAPTAEFDTQMAKIVAEALYKRIQIEVEQHSVAYHEARTEELYQNMGDMSMTYDEIRKHL